jgi:hypothetical protein
MGQRGQDGWCVLEAIVYSHDPTNGSYVLAYSCLSKMRLPQGVLPSTANQKVPSLTLPSCRLGAPLIIRHSSRPSVPTNR